MMKVPRSERIRGLFHCLILLGILFAICNSYTREVSSSSGASPQPIDNNIDSSIMKKYIEIEDVGACALVALALFSPFFL